MKLLSAEERSKKMYRNEFTAVFDYAKDKVDDIELMFIGNNSFSARVHSQQIEAFDYAEAKGISIRVLKNGKSGYAFTEKIDVETLLRTVDIAIINADAIESEEQEFINNYDDVKEKPVVYNPDLDKIKVEEKIALLKEMESLAFQFDKRVINVPYVMYGDSNHSSKIANSKGLNKEDKQNYAY
jgi:PmbA protein